MELFETKVKNAERMMTRAKATSEGVELTFADGCKGVVPYSEIPEIQKTENLLRIELPNPYLLNIYGATGETAELPWDFARHYCDSSYRSAEEAIALDGMQSLGKRIRSIREEKGMTQSGLAGAAGIGRVTEVRIESGEQSPRYENLIAIAQALGVPMSRLVSPDITSEIERGDKAANPAAKKRARKVQRAVKRVRRNLPI
jgi:transcriptional regulator with XRE-family HTH domain